MKVLIYLDLRKNHALQVRNGKLMVYQVANLWLKSHLHNLTAMPPTQNLNIVDHI